MGMSPEIVRSLHPLLLGPHLRGHVQLLQRIQEGLNIETYSLLWPLWRRQVSPILQQGELHKITKNIVLILDNLLIKSYRYFGLSKHLNERTKHIFQHHKNAGVCHTGCGYKIVYNTQSNITYVLVLLKLGDYSFFESDL